MVKKVIGLIGAIGSGKDTVAKALTKKQGEILSVATPVRMVVAALLGMTYEDFMVLYNDRNVKESKQFSFSLDGSGTLFSLRDLMKIVGTKWVKNDLDDNYWLLRLNQLIKESKEQFFVIPDIRHTNEYDFVLAYGGMVCHVDNQIAVKEQELAEAGVVPSSEALFWAIEWQSSPKSYTPSLKPSLKVNNNWQQNPEESKNNIAVFCAKVQQIVELDLGY